MRSYPYVSGGTAQIRIPVIMRSSTDGSLLAGLASTAITCNYQINGSTTGVTVGAGTAGTWGSGHWVAASHSSGGDPKAGHYEFGVPAACFQTDNVVVKIAFSATGALTTVVTFSVGGELGRADAKIDTIHGKLPSSTYLAGTTMSDGRQTQVTGSVGSVVSAVSLSSSERTATAGVVWATLTSGLTTDGSIGKLLVTLFGGITSLASWLRALVRKDAPDATAASEINSGGGAYDATTDSQEAIRDRGDAAWVTGTLDAAGVRAAIGMSAANLDTQLGTLATASSIVTLGGYIDTEVASILSIVGSGTHGNAALLTAIQGVSAGSGLTAQQTRDAMALALGDGVTAADGSIDSLISSISGGASGDGDTPVDHNTGGTDALRYTLGGDGADNVVIKAYLKSEYDAGTRTLRGTAHTGPDGRWLAPLMLNAGAIYTLVASLPGVTEATTTNLTVPS